MNKFFSPSLINQQAQFSFGTGTILSPPIRWGLHKKSSDGSNRRVGTPRCGVTVRVQRTELCSQHGLFIPAPLNVAQTASRCIGIPAKFMSGTFLRAKLIRWKRSGVRGPSYAALSVVALILTLFVAGCHDPNSVHVKLSSRPSPGEDLLRLEIQAQVTGPLAGLRYRWFSVSGACEPQESDSPTTTFKFSENTSRDRVSVELWRDGKMVARNDFDVVLDEDRLRAESQHTIGVKVTITNIPPYDPYGGDKTHADIAGNIDGKAGPDCKIVVYARAGDTWYIQPRPESLLPIQPDNTWTSWTHTGASYAVLVVQPGYDPHSRLDLLPPVGGYVLGRTVVDGMKK
jgi:hypothetical protein